MENADRPKTPETPAAAHAPGKPTVKDFLIKRLWWLPLSFGVPFLVVFLLTTKNMQADSILLSTRSAVVGLSTAFVIFVLASLDSLIKEPGPKVKDVNAEILAKAMGIVLWVIWMGTGHIMLLAQDEISGDLPPAQGQTY
jgi:hypothetical protein